MGDFIALKLPWHSWIHFAVLFITGLQNLQLDKTPVHLPITAFTEPSAGTSQQGGSFLVSTYFISRFLVIILILRRLGTEIVC